MKTLNISSPVLLNSIREYRIEGMKFSLFHLSMFVEDVDENPFRHVNRFQWMFFK